MIMIDCMSKIIKGKRLRKKMSKVAIAPTNSLYNEKAIDIDDQDDVFEFSSFSSPSSDSDYGVSPSRITATAKWRRKSPYRGSRPDSVSALQSPEPAPTTRVHPKSNNSDTLNRRSLVLVDGKSFMSIGGSSFNWDKAIRITQLSCIHHSAKDLARLLLGKIDELKVYLESQDPDKLPTLVNTRLSSIDSQGAHGNLTPLGFAIFQDSYELAELLLSKGADATLKPCSVIDEDPHDVDIEFTNPLHLATARFCETQIVDLILDYAPCPDEKPALSFMQSVIIYLTHCEDMKLIDKLIPQLTTLNVRCDSDNRGALHYAVINNNMQCLHRLLKENITIDQLTRSRKTPLMFACDKNNEQMVRELILNGASVNFQNAAGRTALHIAVRKSSRNIIDLLLTNGADISHRTRKGQTPVDYIFIKGTRDMSKMLRSDPHEDKGAIVERFIIHSSNQLSFDVERFHEATDYLFCHGESEEAMIELLDKHQHLLKRKRSNTATLMHTAAKYNQPTVISWLLNHKMNTGQRDADGFLPIHCAFQTGAMFCINLLIDAGADINSTSTQGWTPLWLALRHDHIDLAVHCIRNGCDLNSSLKLNSLRQAESHIKLPLSLFNPEEQQKDPRTYARNGCRSLLLVEYVIHKGYFKLAKLLLKAGAPTAPRVGSFYKTRDQVKDYLPKLIKERLEAENANIDADGSHIRINSLNILQKKLTKVSSLQDCARLAVRKSLKTNILEKVSTLPVDEKIQSFITLEKPAQSP